jgi:hypothetical protein
MPHLPDFFGFFSLHGSIIWEGNGKVNDKAWLKIADPFFKLKRAFPVWYGPKNRWHALRGDCSHRCALLAKTVGGQICLFQAWLMPWGKAMSK